MYIKAIISLFTSDYQCGSSANWSSTFTLKTINESAQYSPTFLVYGDFGYENAQSMSRIAEEVDGGTIDAILHIGDLAYDLVSVCNSYYNYNNYF